MVFFVFSTLWYFSVGLPDYKKLSNYSPPISSRVYSDQGKLIAEYALEKKTTAAKKTKRKSLILWLIISIDFNN